MNGYLQCPGCGINIHWDLLAQNFELARKHHDTMHEKIFNNEMKFEEFNFLRVDNG